MRRGDHAVRFQELLRRFTQIGLLEAARQLDRVCKRHGIIETDQIPELGTRPVSYPDSKDRARRSSFLVC